MTFSAPTTASVTVQLDLIPKLPEADHRYQLVLWDKEGKPISGPKFIVSGDGDERTFDTIELLIGAIQKAERWQFDKYTPSYDPEKHSWAMPNQS